VADDQQAPVGGHRAHRIERLDGVEATPERRVDRKHRPLLLTPCLRRQLSGLARTHARAEQHHVEGSVQPPDGDARGVRLLAPPLGQAALGIRACAMRLGLRVTK
jgi:hypothetical protein